MGSIWLVPNAIRTSAGEWTKEVELEDFDGTVEDMMADSTKAQDGTGDLETPPWERTSKILSYCTVRIGNEKRGDKDRDVHPDLFVEQWKYAYSSDRLCMMAKLREQTLGWKHVYSTTCPHCGKEIPRAVADLRKQEVTQYPIEKAKEMIRTATLPRSGAVITWSPLIGEGGESALMEMVQKHKAEFLSAVLYLRLKTLNGEKPSFTQVVKMHPIDRRFMGNLFDKEEGGYDTKVDVTCDKLGCGKSFSTRLAVTSLGFFVPTELDEASSGTSPTSPKPGDGPQTTSSSSPSVAALA